MVTIIKYVFIQTKPTGQPEILKLSWSLEKLDLQKLKNDIPKYVRAGLPTDKLRFWENLDNEVQQLMSLSPGPSVLCALKKRKQEQLENDAHQDDSRDPAISSTIHSALEKERTPLPQVWCMNILNIIPGPFVGKKGPGF